MKKRRAIIGTFWKTLAQANKDARKKCKRFGFSYAVQKYTNGFLVVALRQLTSD